ncbi:MAG: hypothetical protein KF802_05965 [Bdellovibrionaceae bacterium]|nr:hypothetical protein [Pseudobdellovibrionaceae bacterium]MBX3032465.1 hypothetical protein [Pseudobdellovibrionaceae bacterium]
MRVDLIPTETWDRLNVNVGRIWPKLQEGHLRVHGGLPMAVSESAMGLAQLFSHKRSVAVIKGNSWIFDGIIPWFLRETYNVQSISLSDLKTSEQIQAWTQGLNKDTVFALFAEDHPLTGETWPWRELDETLNRQKIFSLRVSHSAFLRDPAEAVLPFSCRFCTVGDNLAVSLSGTRLKLQAPVSSSLVWETQAVEQTTERRLQEGCDEKVVLDFEAQFPEQRFFVAEAPRVFDRAVLVFKDVSGEALLRRLAAKLAIAPAFGGLMDTANLCRWDSLRLYRGWWTDAPHEDVLRGLVTFSMELLKRNGFAKALRDEYDVLRRGH